MEGSPDELNADTRTALELLHQQGSVTVAALRAAGVSMPAQALYALQLAGHPVRRSGATWRLVDPSEPKPVQPAPPPRVRRVTRDQTS